MKHRLSFFLRDRLLDEDATYRNNELLELFSDFRILRYKDTVARPDWGSNFRRIVLYDLKRRTETCSVPGATGMALRNPQPQRSDGE
jgi:hypothetical protein